MGSTSGLGFLTTDRDLVVRSWNAWLSSATGLPEEQALGRLLIELIAPARRDLYREILAEVLERGTPRVLAPAFHHYLFACPPSAPSPNFEHMQQRVTVAPLRGDDVAGVIVTIEDVTAALDEQRALAARLEQRGSDAESGDLIAAVGASNWRVRSAAVRTLRQTASREDLAHLLASLEQNHQSLDVLSSALRVLVSANRDVVPPLIALLGDPHPNLRMHAALALGELRDPQAVPALIAALDDGDANVRFHAIEALGRMAAAAAVEPLTRIAESGDFFLSFPAIDALARTDDPRVAPTLLGLLGNDLLRPAVVDTLAALGDEEAVAPLVARINAGDAEVGPIAAALERIHTRYEHTFAAGEQIVELARASMTSAGVRTLAAAIERRATPLESLVTVYAWTAAGSAELLAGLIGDPSVGQQAARSVLATGRAAVVPVIESLAVSERPGRLVGAELLGRLGDRRAVPALCELLTEVDADLVATAAAALATLGDPAALDHLLPLFAHEHAGVRQAAIAAVNAIAAASVEPRIRQRLGDDDPRVRECAVRVAGYFGFDACVPGILAALHDPVEDVRRAAIEQLPVLESAQARERLAAAVAAETPRNRAAAAHAARVDDDPALDGVLLAALGDADHWVRYFAACSLGERRHGPAVEPLATVAAGDPAPHVRIAALQAIAVLDPDAAAGVAARFVGEADSDIACAALTAASRARDARVDEWLEQAVRSGTASVRSCAIEALTRRASGAAVDALAWAARLTDAPAVAAQAIAGLATVASGEGDAARRAVSALVDIGDAEPGRSDVGDALGRLPPAAIESVTDVLLDPRPAARLVAVDALARMRHPRASAALLTALSDPDAFVRAAAVGGFGRLGNPAAGPAIAELRASDPDPLVRRKADSVCRRYGWRRR